MTSSKSSAAELSERKKMIKVYTHFNRPKTIPVPEGSEWQPVYQEQINEKTGKKEIVKIGETNIYEKIQADLESTKIENILHQVAMGDLAALNQREGTYFDATTMPKNLMEAQNLVIRMKDEFNKMPTEVKELFHNSAEEYVFEMGTDNFNEKMAPYNKKIADIKEAGSLKEYNKRVAEQAKFEKDVAAAKGANE